jgi:thiol-disulfide isomerase/thioredoxin
VTEFGETFAARKARRVYVKEKNIDIGKTVPSYSVSDVSDTNRLITNLDLEGKIYLIDFWASWCGPCIDEIPNLNEVYEMYQKNGFEILSISLDENILAVSSFRQKGKYPMPWINTFAKGSFQGDIAEKFELVGIPKPILVDRNGKIIALGEDLRGHNLKKTISNFLN